MTAPLPLSPADHAALARLVEERWPAIVRQQGLDPARIGVKVLELGGIYWHSLLPPPRPYVPDAEARAARAALEELARDLEDEGWAVARDGGGPRVVGWAAIPCTSAIHDATNGRGCTWSDAAKATLVRIVDLDHANKDALRAFHAYFDALTAGRLAQRQGPAVDVKREGALRRGRAAYGGGR